MTRINLLPPEVRKQRSNARLARSITVFGLAVAALLGGLYLIRTWEIISLNGDLRSLEADRAIVEARFADVEDVAAQQDAVEYGRNVVRALLAGEISWSEQMLKLASTVPGGFRLSSLSGTRSVDPQVPVVGSMAWTASSSGYIPTEGWLGRLATQEGWGNPWLTSVQAEGPELTVNGSVDLTAASVTLRGGGPA